LAAVILSLAIVISALILGVFPILGALAPNLIPWIAATVFFSILIPVLAYVYASSREN